MLQAAETSRISAPSIDLGRLEMLAAFALAVPSIWASPALMVRTMSFGSLMLRAGRSDRGIAQVKG
jgi:hypothetical protein